MHLFKKHTQIPIIGNRESVSTTLHQRIFHVQKSYKIGGVIKSDRQKHKHIGEEYLHDHGTDIKYIIIKAESHIGSIMLLKTTV
jgi:hypothetical protein